MIIIKHVWSWKKEMKTKAVRSKMMIDISLAFDKKEVTSHSKYVWETKAEVYLAKPSPIPGNLLKRTQNSNFLLCTI